MKKIIFAVLTVVIAIVIRSNPVIASDMDRNTSGIFTYTLDNNGKATITGLSDSLTGQYANRTFEIPSTLDGHPVIAIGDEAFKYNIFGYNCTIVIPNGVQTIGKKAFYGTIYGTVKIPASVRAFGIWDYVFSYSRAEAIDVDPDNTELASLDGVLFSKDLSTLYAYPINRSGSVYAAPPQTRTLCCTSFGNSSITKIYLLNPNVTFYTYTFFGCDITVYATQERVNTWERQRTDTWPQGNVTFKVLPDVMNFNGYIAPEGCVFQFRLYNPNSGEHFYTGSQIEAINLINVGWNFEGSGFITPTVGTPIYRLYSAEHGDHYYTTNVAEKNALVAEGWTLDGGTGIAFPSADASTGRPMYKVHNPNAYPNGEAGAHHFTMSWQEVQNLVAIGWEYEGIAWYSVQSLKQIVLMEVQRT